MKGHKGEGAMQSEGKGALGAGERGPLFPRLHVSETKKAGPKAPPRNKMALYEQFTIPSHRFVQPSQTSATAVYQQQYGSHELACPYLPYYMPSVPYSNTNHGVQVYSQPSHGTSSSGITNGSGMVNTSSSRKIQRHHKVGKLSPCRVSRGLTEASADCTTTGKDADAALLSSVTNRAEESTNSLQNAVPNTERSSITNISESVQEALSTVEGMECMVPEGQRHGYPRVKTPTPADLESSTFMIGEGQLHQAPQHCVYETSEQTKEGALVELPGQSCLQTQSTRAECKDESETRGLTSHAHCTAESRTSIELKSFKEIGTMIAEDQNFLSSKIWAVVSPGSNHTCGETSRIYGPKSALKNFITDVENVDDSIEGLSAIVLRPDIESSEEPNDIWKKNDSLSLCSENGARKGGYSDDVVMSSTSSDSMSVIKPKNVIHAIGQQQFWKARRTLVRQQRVFSDQVFQLHKLIKIQQLLAETPGTFIDEDIYFETKEECDVAPLVKRAVNPNEDAHNVSFKFKDGSEGKSLEAGGQSKRQWEHTQAVGKDGIGSSKSMLEFSSGGLTAWGCPSLGQWVGSMAAQGQPFGYQPFARTLPPGSAFGLPYGPALQGSVSPIISFGITCDQRQELPAEMGSNYGSPTVLKHEDNSTVNSSSSHGFNNLDYQERHVAGSGIDVPTGSGTSFNKCPVTVQGVKTSRVLGLSHQWGLNDQSGSFNTDSLECYARQSDNSSPSIATTLLCHTSSTPSTPPAKKLGFSCQDVESLAQGLHLASVYGPHSSDQYDSVRSVENEELDTRTPKHSKGQKEGVCLCIDGRLSDANDLNHSALDLFPLVPSLNSSGRNGAKVVKAAEEGQGRVIRAVPRRAIAASESAAGILLSLQRERQK